MVNSTLPTVGTDTPAEQAWRAVQRFDKKLPSLNAWARALTGDASIRVVKSSGTPCTDGKTIYMRPPFELGVQRAHASRSLCGERDDRLVLLCEACRGEEEMQVTLYHEVAHIVFGSFDTLADRDARDVIIRAVTEQAGNSTARAAKLAERIRQANPRSYMAAASAISPYLGPILNAYEDARVNQRMFDARPGTKIMFHGKMVSIFDDGVQQEDGSVVRWDQMPGNAQAIVGLFAAASGYKCDGWFAPDVEALLATDEIRAILHQMTTARSVKAVYRLGFPTLEALRKYGFCKAPDDPEDDPAPKPESHEDGEGEAEPTPKDDSGEAEPTEPQNDNGAAEADQPDQAPELESGDECNDGDAGDAEGDPEPGDGGSTEGDDLDVDDAFTEAGGEGEASASDEGEASDDTSDEGDDTSDSASEATEASEGASEGDEASDEGEASDSASEATEASDEGEGASDEGEGASDEGEGASEGDEASDEGEGASDEGEGDEASEGATEGDEGDEATSDEATEADDGDQEPEDQEGAPDEVQRALEQFGGHGEVGAGEAAQQRQDDAEVDRAVSQADFFDAPSEVIAGVRLRYFDTDDGTESWQMAWGNRWYPPTPKSDERILGPALQQMRVTFAENRAAKRVRNLKSGPAINNRVLAKRAPVGDPRVFSKRTIPGKRDYFVVIGLDISGSTAGGNRLEMIKSAAMAQADLLTRVGIPFVVYAHSGNYTPGRDDSLDVDIFVIKEANEPWNDKTRERLAVIRDCAGNLDGHTLEFYRKVCDTRTETDKIILYYTDGSMPAANYAEELQILQREIKTCQRKRYTLIGVGIQNDDPARYGLETVRIDRLDQVSTVVRFLRDRLT